MSAIDLVREVCDSIGKAAVHAASRDDEDLAHWAVRLEDALAEMERDEPFIEAAATYEELLSRDMRNAANKEEIQQRIATLHSNMVAAGRARREGGKHA